MRHTALYTISMAFLCAFQSEPAPAQPTRVFVAAQGLDSNPCTFALPCRTFQHAHDVVVAGGEIDVLDPAGYGALTINKAISIQGHGFAGISAPGAGTIAISISAGASDKVNLRGLLIDGVGTGHYGINFAAGASLNVQECLIRGFGNTAFLFGSGANAASLFVTDTVISDSNFGLFVTTGGAGALNAVIERVLIEGNSQYGLNVNGSAGTGTLDATVANSVISGNGVGMTVQSAAAQSTVNVMVRYAKIANNGGAGGQGIFANSAQATVRVARSTITGNTGIAVNAINGATLSSYGDNNVDGNTNDGAFTGTILPK